MLCETEKSAQGGEIRKVRVGWGLQFWTGWHEASPRRWSWSRYEGGERKRHLGKNIPTEGRARTKALGLEHHGMFQEQQECQEGLPDSHPFTCCSFICSFIHSLCNKHFTLPLFARYWVVRTLIGQNPYPQGAYNAGEQGVKMNLDDACRAQGPTQLGGAEGPLKHRTPAHLFFLAKKEAFQTPDL